MNNSIQTGKVITLTAPAGGVVSGVPVQIGQLLVVPVATVAQGLPFEGDTMGVFTLLKDTAQALTEGQLVYWDDTASEISTTAAGNLLAGFAIQDALAADATAPIRLDGIAQSSGRLGVFSNLNRPLPTAVGASLTSIVEIWNSTSKSPNFSDGIEWYTAAGVITT